MKIVHEGVGSIGKDTIILILDDQRLKIVGLVDTNPEYTGKDLGKLLGTDNLGIKVRADLKALLRETKPDIVVQTTSSTLEEITPSIEAAVRNGINVVTSAEQSVYPEFISKEKADYIDRLARENNVRVLGTGVNPGFAMDTYPLQVYKNEGFDNLISMTVYRWDDTTERRVPLLRKTGAGLNINEFDELDRQGKLGHVGLKMSAAYLADNIGLKDHEIIFKKEPILAKQSVKPKYGEEIKAGDVAGMHENCIIITDKQSITLDLRMYVGAENRNSGEIVGIKDQNEHTKSIEYGNIVNGDIATARILKDAISHVIKGPSGLNRIDYVPNPNKLLRK